MTSMGLCVKSCIYFFSLNFTHFAHCRVGEHHLMSAAGNTLRRGGDQGNVKVDVEMRKVKSKGNKGGKVWGIVTRKRRLKWWKWIVRHLSWLHSSRRWQGRECKWQATARCTECKSNVKSFSFFFPLSPPSVFYQPSCCTLSSYVLCHQVFFGLLNSFWTVMDLEIIDYPTGPGAKKI